MSNPVLGVWAEAEVQEKRGVVNTKLQTEKRNVAAVIRW